MERRLEGKTILVAGGGGIGGELALRYAREGAAIVLGDVDEAGAGAVAAEIRAAGGKAIATVLDGADDASIAGAVKRAVSQFGGLDGCHANFASFQDGIIDVGVTDLPLDVYDLVMGVNARGYLLCTKHALPALIARGGGAMIYTSSGAAHSGDATRVAYAMSKAAGHALMRHVAKRYGAQGIRANAIAPGIIMHPRLEAAVGPEFIPWAKSRIPLQTRLGNPGDIAALSALLMSDEGAYITGQVISVDGGGTMRP
jgi:NAD(P)-dependent dehydrogenase (short-subunit alcohol dehydrogenase family)